MRTLSRILGIVVSAIFVVILAILAVLYRLVAGRPFWKP